MRLARRVEAVSVGNEGERGRSGGAGTGPVAPSGGIGAVSGISAQIVIWNGDVSPIDRVPDERPYSIKLDTTPRTKYIATS